VTDDRDRRERSRRGRRPPWWPDNEAWPPEGDWSPPWTSRGRPPWAAAGGPPWRRGGPPWAARRRGRQRGFGCLFALAFLVGVWAIVAFVGAVLAAVGLGRPFEPIHLVVLIVVALVVIGLARRVGRSAYSSGRTLDQVVEAARRVEGGDLSARVPERDAAMSDVRDLVRGFNKMAERLETDERQRRTLLADVSHELRTPISIVQGSVEAILDGVHAADEQHLSAILEETRVLARLVEDLRTVALAEAGTLPLHREPTDLAILIADVVASFESVAASSRVIVRADVPDSLPLLEIDPVRVREILGNLVENALRYTGPEGTVTITARAEAGTVRIDVADTGTGIDPAVLPHVFDRFAKSAESRGSGLGLAIARNLVVAHGGTIDVTSGRGGTTFTARLPG